MPEYHVYPHRLRWESTTILVKCATPAEALAKARKQVERDLEGDGDLDWEPDDIHAATCNWMVYDLAGGGLLLQADELDADLKRASEAQLALPLPPVDPEEERRRLADRIWSVMGMKPV